MLLQQAADLLFLLPKQEGSSRDSKLTLLRSGVLLLRTFDAMQRQQRALGILWPTVLPCTPTFTWLHSKLASPECTDSEGRHRLGKLLRNVSTARPCSGLKKRCAWAPLYRGAFEGRMHNASLSVGVLLWLAHDASTARLRVRISHDLSVCIWALQLKSSGARPRFGMCCHHGKVKLPPPHQLPQPLLDLLRGRDLASEQFLPHWRAYNSPLPLASHVYQEPDAGHWGQHRPALPSSFRIQGHPAHLIGPLLPDAGSHPVFVKIYCSDLDYDAQVLRRMQVTRTLEARLMRRL